MAAIVSTSAADDAAQRGEDLSSNPQIRMSTNKDQWKPIRKTPSEAHPPYRIGEIGMPWGDEEKATWLEQTSKKRSYIDEVVRKLDAVDKDLFEIRRYGELSKNPELYPLMAAISKDWDAAKPSVLVTGGVHGYETSGVQGTILFLTSRAAEYASKYNIVVCPCVSPWGYEHIERWNPICLDPNRSFGSDPATHTEESSAVIALLASLGVEGSSEEGANPGWVCHVDCHETTDTDESEFMPARAALGGSVYKPCDIPDGFYLVGDSDKPQLEWHKAVIDAVREVTHIAPGDDNGTIIEEPLVQDGVIVVPATQLGLCASVTPAAYATTTEVYPDSPTVTDDQCNLAQVDQSPAHLTTSPRYARCKAAQECGACSGCGGALGIERGACVAAPGA
eukprot:CAMPEP_0119502470 /NCGR_PEP_ID=MMETSP1344-20130328/23928_1 /TAXON_ID=236787 /ORGANISM="Florenciella parvula, Strain CCMP2471" /LENGTH=392 /DNA_ID=CAMNT_0007538683 /DNA_START=5 /DNA_END=1184 /DNA_ORIENTATION=+